MTYNLKRQIYISFSSVDFFFRMFGTSGNCAACCKPIPAFEMVMRAKSNVYHLDCFACQQCHQRYFNKYLKKNWMDRKLNFKKIRFCVGDRIYLSENKILCEYDYEERLVAANMPSNNNNNNNGSTQQHSIQRRVSDILPQVRPSSPLASIFF